MNRDTLRQAGRLIAEHCGLDAAASVMVGCISAAGVRATPSAEDRAELVSIAGSSGDIERFIEAATSRAVQFFGTHRKAILTTAERLSAENLVPA